MKYFFVFSSALTPIRSLNRTDQTNKPTHLSTMDSSVVVRPRLPPHIIKYIAGFAPTQTQGDYAEYAEYVLSIFRAFMPNENDDYAADYYKKSVQQYLAVLIQGNLVEWFYGGAEAMQDEQCLFNTLTLSPQDMMDLYETTFVSHYSQTYGSWSETPNLAYADHDKLLQIFMNITQLLEHYTTLCETEEIMGCVSYPMNVKDLKFITLLERSLRGRRACLLIFIHAHMYAPIMAFYLYAKHNHVDYRTDQNSLANDEWLLDLLLHDGYQKEVLALAIGGLFPNDFVYEETSSTDDIRIEKHMVMPNREVVKYIIDQFPAISDKLIPFYMKSRIEIDVDEIYGEEGPAEITPLGYWHYYKNTFEERTYIDRCNDIFRKRTITVEKDESIRMCLLTH